MYFVAVFLRPKADLFVFQVTKVRPTDKDAKSKYTECNKMVKKLAFEKAISVDDTKKNIASTINLDAMSNLQKIKHQ